MACEQYTISYQQSGDPAATMYAVENGTYNGYPAYDIPFYVGGAGTVYAYYVSGVWYISATQGETDLTLVVATSIDVDGSLPLGTWDLQMEGAKFDFINVDGCNEACNCITIYAVSEGVGAVTIQASASGQYNSYNYYEFSFGSIGYYLWYDSINSVWKVTAILGGTPTLASLNDTINLCAEGDYRTSGGTFDSFVVESRDCGGCTKVQDRIYREYTSIKLPIPFNEENRGWKGCCECRMMVLAGGPTDSWKNDVTSAWIKLSDPADTVTFRLEKDGVITSYTPPVYAFPNEPNAFYTTIKWRDVLSSDGQGCYDLKVEYNISGLLGAFTWGEYYLRPYSVQNALKTARIRVKFNLRQEVEGINFTDANVEDTIRFYGFIGERQPNTEIDNLIHQDRTIKSVVRENLDVWTITTDPLEDCLMYKLTDLYLLSENEMFISDYNVHNHSYRIQDIPVILQESPEIDYLDIWQRKAKLTALVGLKKANRRTYY